MNKSDLINSIAEDAKITKVASKLALESIIENIEKTLKKGEKVSLLGFGSWSVSERAERKGRNPQTGKTIKIAAKRVIKFKPGNILKDTDDTGPMIKK